jgi:segregation and condensation protein A
VNLFEATTTITTIVATFLAVLELTRLGEILVQQDRAFADIRCERGTNTGFSFENTLS